MARFFVFFHALSFELNFFSDRRCPLRGEDKRMQVRGDSLLGISP